MYTLNSFTLLAPNDKVSLDTKKLQGELTVPTQPQEDYCKTPNLKYILALQKAASQALEKEKLRTGNPEQEESESKLGKIKEALTFTDENRGRKVVMSQNGLKLCFRTLKPTPYFREMTKMNSLDFGTAANNYLLSPQMCSKKEILRQRTASVDNEDPTKGNQLEDASLNEISSEFIKVENEQPLQQPALIPKKKTAVIKSYPVINVKADMIKWKNLRTNITKLLDDQEKQRLATTKSSSIRKEIAAFESPLKKLSHN